VELNDLSVFVKVFLIKMCQGLITSGTSIQFFVHVHSAHSLCYKLMKLAKIKFCLTATIETTGPEEKY